MRLYSSAEIAAALRRLGCEHRRTKGSHAVYSREVPRPDGSVRTVSAPIVLGKREMDRRTLASILKLLDISEGDFEAAVR